jgi:hypothetical protein
MRNLQCNVVRQMSDVIHYLEIRLFTEYVSYEGMGFWQAVHLIHCYLWVDLGSSRYSFTHSLAYAIFQNSSRCTNQHHTSHKNTMCSLFCSSLDTHGYDVTFLLRVNAGNVSLPADLFFMTPQGEISWQYKHISFHCYNTYIFCPANCLLHHCDSIHRTSFIIKCWLFSSCILYICSFIINTHFLKDFILFI